MTALAQERPVLAGPAAERLPDHVDTASGPVREPAAGVGGLATVLGRFMGVGLGRPARERPGGDLFDAVITGAGPFVRAAVAVMDEIPDGCGGVIARPEAGWFSWLVPPGSARTRHPHPYTVCLSTPHSSPCRP
ncbi:hypothetical protein [Streptomyces sp. NPDC058861]|uniref:hypothetical protein n=1 Tax=Streptomyces sp. NPDC058861 TaxID=3346653 RepID=UPI00368BD725